MPNTTNLSNVNVGSSANAGDGDVLREAFIKVNANFNAVYNSGQYKSYLSDTQDFPGYSWDGDTNTGMYHAGTGKIGFTIKRRKISHELQGISFWEKSYLLTKNIF